MKPAALLASILLGIIALGHLLRLAMGVDIVAGGWPVPMWMSAVGAIVAGGLAGLLWRESRHV